MPSFRELLAKTKGNIREVDPAQAEQRLVPGAVFIPRGHLESQVESKITNRDAPIVVYCAGGVRSAFAAETLQDLGYTDVVSMAGGFGRWKNEGRPWITPAVLSPEQRSRYHRHILLPEVGE